MMKGRKSTMAAASKRIADSGEEAAIAARKLVLAALLEATPVDTGKARAGWKIGPNGIHNDVPYINDINQSNAHLHFIETAVLSVPGVSIKGSIVVDN